MGDEEPVQQRKDQSRVYRFVTAKHTSPAGGPRDTWDLLSTWRRADIAPGIMGRICQVEMRCIICATLLDAAQHTSACGCTVIHAPSILAEDVGAD